MNWQTEYSSLLNQNLTEGATNNNNKLTTNTELRICGRNWTFAIPTEFKSAFCRLSAAAALNRAMEEFSMGLITLQLGPVSFQDLKQLSAIPLNFKKIANNLAKKRTEYFFNAKSDVLIARIRLIFINILNNIDKKLARNSIALTQFDELIKKNQNHSELRDYVFNAANTFSLQMITQLEADFKQSFSESLLKGQSNNFSTFDIQSNNNNTNEGDILEIAQQSIETASI